MRSFSRHMVNSKQVCRHALIHIHFCYPLSYFLSNIQSFILTSLCSPSCCACSLIYASFLYVYFAHLFYH